MKALLQKAAARTPTTAENKLLGSILDGMLKMQGLNAIYSKTFWDISSEMGEYRQPFNGKSLELIIKKFIKLIDKNLKY